MMRKRSVEILTLLLHSGNENVTITSLSESYQLSERTLRNDIHLINDCLGNARLPAVVIGENGTLHFKAHIDRVSVMKELGKADSYFYCMQPKERDDIILAVLLTSNGYTTTNDLSEILSVSRPTVIKDINRLRSTCFHEELKLQSMPGIGLKLEYNERVFRRELRRIVTDYFTVVAENSGVFQSILLKTLNFQITLDTIAKLVRKSERKHRFQLSDTGYVLLSCFLFVAANRVAQGFCIDDVQEISEDEESKTVSQIFDDIMRHLELPVSEGELIQVRRTAKTWPLMAPTQFNSNYIALENYTAKFIDSLSKEFEIDFLHDKSLFDFTIYYIDEILQRYKSGLCVENPLTEQVREKYQMIFETVKKSTRVFADGLGLAVDDGDVAYLTMYVVAADERLNRYGNVPQVLIVCPGSMATGQFLVSQIHKQFSFKIKDVCSVRNLYDEGKLDDIDLIISTTPAWNEQCPFVVVNPLLKLEDIKHIQEATFQVMNSGQGLRSCGKPSEDILDKLHALITRQPDPVIKDRICAELQNVLARFKDEEMHKCSRLAELTTPEMVDITTMCDDWREAIERVGKLLERQGKIKEEYIDSCIQNCETNGPYFVLSDGLAIAHTHPGDGLIEPAVGLLFIKEGVSFQHKSYGSVRLLFLVCLREPNNKLLKLLIDCAKDAEFIRSLEKQTNGQETYRLLCEYEESADAYGGKE